MSIRDPRKLLATADLHLTLYPEGDTSAFELARHVCESDADAFIIAGDVADMSLGSIASCLRLFEGFEGLKLLVPGNHDLWVRSGDSKERYRTELPRVARECGFHMLDLGPATAGSWGFVGSIGWYDYSLKNPDLGLSAAVYRSKSLPGVCSWNDAAYIRWDMIDEEFTEHCVRQLRLHYEAVESHVEQVVAVLHHVPFAELLFETGSTALEFCRAYMGSRRLGQLLLRCPKVRFAICGHQHTPSIYEPARLKAFVVGSEYRIKRLLQLDLKTGDHECVEFRPKCDEGAPRCECQ